MEQARSEPVRKSRSAIQPTHRFAPLIRLPDSNVRGAASAPGLPHPRPVTLAASARSTSNAPPLRDHERTSRNPRQQNRARPQSRFVRARLRRSSRASLPLTPQAGTPTATIGMRPATPLRTKTKLVKLTPSGCRKSSVLLRVQRCPRPSYSVDALSRKHVREHLQSGWAAGRWQRWQCRVAAFYFQRIMANELPTALRPLSYLPSRLRASSISSCSKALA